ncbi:MAG: helix-turn-helix transcriptional regulator [Myxococcota bacterium]|nr:helix-turn-helix transcriptional regulator [Myxococcota bacterium]
MADVPSRGVHVPSGSRDWLLPMADPRARPLRSGGVSLVGISEVGRGFDWPGPAATHLVLGSIAGTGRFEAEGFPARELAPGDLVLSPAGRPRRHRAHASRWTFLAIRLADEPRWARLREGGVRVLPGRWLRRLVPPVEGMLAEHPLGDATTGAPQASLPGGEHPFEYLRTRHADRFARPGPDDPGDAAPPDAFQLHATILRSHLDAMLSEASRSDGAEHGDEGLRLADLWAQVRDRPRGPWDTDHLAGALGVSRATLYRMVKRAQGTSPARVVEQVRMQEACRLLTDGPHAIDVIADQVGYATGFSFSAAFKRVIGEAPSRFRARRRGA